MIRLGIIGCGGIASLHSANILGGQCPEVCVTALADRKENRRQWAHEKYPDAAIFTEGSDLIASDACEAVLICTPHYQHPILAEDAFQHGKHVLCEKPAGVFTKAVKAMNESAARHPELTFGMMFNQRTNCIYRKVKSLLDSGELGQLKRVTWIITDWYRTQAYYDAGAWRATWDGEGGGVLLNQCPHQLDLLQWICGMPQKVRAFCHIGKWHDIEVEDDVTAYLEFPNGATGVFIASTGDALGENRLELVGTRGRLLVGEDSISFDQLTVDERDWCPVCKEPFGKPETKRIPVETDGLNLQHSAVLNNFAAHILRGTPLIADGSEGIRSLTLSNAMHLSDWQEKTVTLPFDEDLFLQLLTEKRAKSRLKKDKDIVVDTEKSIGTKIKR